MIFTSKIEKYIDVSKLTHSKDWQILLKSVNKYLIDNQNSTRRHGYKVIKMTATRLQKSRTVFENNMSVAHAGVDYDRHSAPYKLSVGKYVTQSSTRLSQPLSQTAVFSGTECPIICDNETHGVVKVLRRM